MSAIVTKLRLAPAVTWGRNMVRFFKVGGMRFVRIGRLQISWCIVRNTPKRVKKHSGRAMVRAANEAYKIGFARGMGWRRPLQIADQSVINRYDL